MRRSLAAAGWLVFALAVPGFAEDAPPPAPPAPQAAPPAATAAPEKSDGPPVDPQVERQRNSAAKLAGMINFVTYFCPEAKPNYPRFKQVIAAMGVDLKELEQGGSLVVKSMSYTEAYRKETEESCKRAFQLFGETGTTVPGLIARKTPEELKEPADKPPVEGKEPEAKPGDKLPEPAR